MTKWFNSDQDFILNIYKLINQGVKTFNDQYYNTHQKSMLSNTIIESDIYDNYSYTSYVNQEIEKTSETLSKKLEFYIDNPETGLKKTVFNMIVNSDEINDMNNNNRDYSSNDLIDDMYNNIDHGNVDWKQTNHNSLYTLADNKQQLSSDLEDLDRNSTDSHEGELIIADDNKVEYKALCSKIFYTLYVKPNEEFFGHLIYRLSTNHIVVTKDYQTVPIPKDPVDTVCESDLYEVKS